MAELKSTSITGRTSQPPVEVDSGLAMGTLRCATQTIATGAALSASDVLRFIRIPVDAYIYSIKLASDDLGDTGDLDLGVHKVNIDGSITVVNADAFAEDIDVNAQAVALTEYRFSALGIETAEQPAWELAGLSARPEYDQFEITATVAELTTAAGDVTVQVLYSTPG